MAQDIVPTKPKDIGKAISIGTLTVWGYTALSPLITGLHSSLAFEIPVIGITLGGMIGAGLAASVTSFLVDKYWK